MGFFTSSIGRKFMMALTGFFLMIFLLVHLGVNLTLFAGEEAFNEASHFMATNPLIQLMQFVLASGFIYHIVLGVWLTLKNMQARGSQRYAVNKWAEHTPFASRTMIYTGVLILLFLVIHIIDFLIPIKMGDVASDYQLVITKFNNAVYVFIYVFSFIALGIHLSHGFASSFQSTGLNGIKKYERIIKGLGVVYFLFISLGFSAIAIYFFIN